MPKYKVIYVQMPNYKVITNCADEISRAWCYYMNCDLLVCLASMENYWTIK